MPTVSGVFPSSEAASKAARRPRKRILPGMKLDLLVPGAPIRGEKLDTLPASETEQPGMGRAVGGVVGGAVGMAAGLELGTAAATILIPGVGPVLAIGLAAAAALGIGGAIGGAAAGQAMEAETTTGLPSDEFFVYRDALKQGRTVLFVQAGDEDAARRGAQLLTNALARKPSTPHVRNGGSDFAPPKPNTTAASAASLKLRRRSTAAATRRRFATAAVQARPIRKKAMPTAAVTNAALRTINAPPPRQHGKIRRLH